MLLFENMNKDQKQIAEHIIDKMKGSKNGLTSLMQITMIVDDPNLRMSIIESLVSDFGLIEKLGHDFRLTSKGHEFVSFAELDRESAELKERENIDFEKTKIDLELAKETLKEFPKTKKRAKIAYISAIVLGVFQIIEWIVKLLE